MPAPRNTTRRDIKIRFRKDIYSNPGDDLESRFAISIAILVERDDQGKEYDAGEFKVKGNAYVGAFCFGYEYRLFGRWEEHPVHGWSFAYESFVVDKPATRDAVIQYLRQCKGFGSVRAGQLFDLHGEECIDILMANPAKVAGEIKGLKVEDCEAAAELLEKSEHIRRSKLDLIGVLAGKGFPRKTTEQILKDYGSESAEAVRRNPYLLMRYRGCGFLKTDKLYLDFQYDPKRLKRQALCAWHAIAKAGDGDTWFQKSQAIKAIRQNVSGVDTDKIDRAILLAMRTEMLAVRQGEMGTQWIAEGKKAAQEAKVARLVVKAMAEAKDNPELVMWPDVESLNLSDHQRHELKKALCGFVCILRGGPGTGKTHCTAELIKAIAATHGIDHVAACAPAGKAAVRMSEAFDKAQVPLRATTIHSLLGVVSSDGGWTFEHNEFKPLPYKFIFADEESMKGIPLEVCFLAARARGCHLLSIGDIEQLSPIEHGAPLRDKAAAGVPCGTLTEVRRNSGRIVQACKEIRETKRFTPSPGLDLDNGENLLVLETDEPEQQIEVMQGTIDKLKASGKYDPVWDVQVLCAVNKKTSPLHRSALNKKLQDQLNPHGKSVAGNPFRVGDKVICLKNGSYESAVKEKVVRGRWETFQEEDSQEDIDEFGPTNPSELLSYRYFKEDPEGSEQQIVQIGKQYVANGEQGEVLTVEPSRFVVRLANPDREVIVMRSSKNDSNEDDSRDPNDESAAEEKTGTGCDWDLGYAISVHKSQGSEWPVVLVMLDDSGAAKQVCSRNWLYTAISRAKVMCLMIGKLARAIEMCRRDGLHRKTFLKELILEGMKDAGLEFPQCVMSQATEEAQGYREEMDDQPFIWTDEAVAELLEGVMG